MVVDDNEDDLRVIELALLKYDIGIEKISNSAKALAYFKEHPDRYSLVIMDIKMPSMSGLELSENFADLNKDCKIVLITAFDQYPDIAETIPWVSEVIRKPFRIQDICDIVEKYLHAKTRK